MLSFNKNSTCLTVFLNGQMHTVPSDSPNFGRVWAAVKTGDEDAVDKSLNVVEAIAEAFERVTGTNGIEVGSDGVYVNGAKMHNALSDKIMEFMQEGLSYDPLVKFLANFMENPLVKLASNPEVLAMMGKSAGQASEIVNEFTDDFYSFLNNKDLPVTDDGNFIAYKAVGPDYFSKTAGNTTLTKGKVVNRKVYNAPGEYIETERGQVDPSRRNECSYGLHVGSIEYVRGFANGSGDKIIVVEVNPKDVVAIPPDCNRQKMRVCAYKVLQDFKGVLTRPAYVTSNYDEDDDFDLYDDDYDNDLYDDDTFEQLEADEVFIGDEIRFTYYKDNTYKTRYLDVSDLGRDEEGNVIRVVGVLMDPEENEGQYRSFKVENMSDVVLYYRS